MDLEKSRAGFISRLLDQEKEKFERLEATERLLDLKYQTDNTMITHLFTKWITKSKSDSQKKTITDCFLAMMRISSYVDTLQTISKSAVSMFLREKKECNRLLTQNTELKRENAILKKMVEDYEQGNL